MPDYVKICEHAARIGGEVLTAYRRRFTVREKAPADLVTEADIASQKAIADFLLGRFPAFGFIGEEQEHPSPHDQAGGEAAPPPGPRPSQPRDAVGSALGTAGDDGQPLGVSTGTDCLPPNPEDDELTWIVDPLDGTTNYVHGLPAYCVSVALRWGMRPLAGCVFDPVSGECFSAGLGKGAYLNGERIRVSQVTQPSEALIALSFPARVLPGSPELLDLLTLIPHCQAFRRLGSSALNLCYVAAGRLDAYFARDAKVWDFAAGALIALEAGGTVGGGDGGGFSLDKDGVTVAATTELYAMLDAIRRQAALPPEPDADPTKHRR
jgi:myo-inositol-1(or 4)-monophosphatase